MDDCEAKGSIMLFFPDESTHVNMLRHVIPVAHRGWLKKITHSTPQDITAHRTRNLCKSVILSAKYSISCERICLSIFSSQLHVGTRNKISSLTFKGFKVDGNFWFPPVVTLDQ